jgi:DnaK suppressor protein
MRKEKLDYFKKLLTIQLNELLGLANNTLISMLDIVDNEPDPLDRASIELERSSLLRIRSRERKLIFKIKDALERIEDGTFGICEICEEEISIGRLKARPVTSHCIECKTKMEAEEKAYQ